MVEAERYAHVRRGTIRDAVMSGEICGFRRSAGSAIIVRIADVDHWIECTWPMSINGFAATRA